MSGKILVLGGTGAMGIYLVPELLAAGFEVFVTSRSRREADRERLYPLQGDARDSTFLQNVLSDVRPDAVVDFMLYGTDEFAARRDWLLEGTGHYIFLSSYRVFADSSPAPLTERSPRLLDVCTDVSYLATDEYALAKARQENQLWDSGRGNWTIVRPGITYSRNRFQFGTLEANTVCYRALQGLPVIMAREILSKNTTMTWAGDVAKLVGGLVLNPAAMSEDYNVVTAEHRLWSEVAGYYREILGLRIMETDLPAYSRVLGHSFQIQFDRMYDRIMDNAKILAATGMVQADLTRLRDGLERELREFVKKPYFQYPDLALNARMDKVTGVRLPLAGLPWRRKIRYWIEKYPGLKKILPQPSRLPLLIRRQASP